MLVDLVNETYDGDLEGVWERERTATAVRAFAVRLHQTGCSVRETATILTELGVERSHGAVWNWVHRPVDSGCDPPTANPSRVAVDETAVKINDEQSWLYAAIDVEKKLILDVALFGRHGTVQRLHSCTVSRGNTTARRRCFLSISTAIGLHLLA